MAPRTLASLALDRLGIAHTLHAYPVDETHLDATEVARAVGLPPAQVFKTLVCITDRGGVVIAVVPGDQELDLKKLARAAGVRSVALAPVKDLERLTGYVRGGVSPLGLKRPHPTYLDAAAVDLEIVSVSAGRRGLQMFLAGQDLKRALGCAVTTLTRDT